MDTDQRPALRLVGPDERAPTPVRFQSGLLRLLLATAGALQVLLGVAQVVGVHVVDVVNGGHVSNKSAAWNIAFGTAFLGVARAGRCNAAVLAMLTAFVATLTLLTVTDLLSGRVGPGRLGTHALLIGGFALVIGLSRNPHTESPPRRELSIHRPGLTPRKPTDEWIS
ncbi:hypothetical protein ACWKSP_20835 [Micromonosporaceae bacterium Da 78-11]